MLETADKYLRANAWPVGTELRLLNVPWDEAYRDVVAWESAAARDEWFEAQQGESWFSNRFNYLWPNQPIAVPVPYSSAYRYNYVAVTNPAQPVDEEGPVRTYYYFVTGVSYLSPQASNLTVQLDVMTTYTDSIRLGRAFVERGHIGMANENCHEDSYFEYLTMPEGIDVGSEYIPTHREYFNFMGDRDEGSYVLVVSSADLTSDPGTVDKPNLGTAPGGSFDGMPNGCSLYAFNARDIGQFMSELSSKSWVAQCVIDLYLIPGAFVQREGSTVRMFGTGMELINNLTTPSLSSSFQSQIVAELDVTDDDFKPVAWDTGDVPEKLLCYPYSVVELSNNTGNPVFLKPEYLFGKNTFICYGCSSAPEPRFAVVPNNYQARYQDADIGYHVIDMNGVSITNVIRQGTGLDNALWFTNFPHITLVNNNYQLYLASNANRIAYQYQSAGWMLDRANMQAGNTYDNALLQTATAMENATRMGNAQLENAQRTFGQNVASTAVSGLESIAANPTPGGIATGAANAMMGLAGAINAQRNTETIVGAAQSSQLASIDTSRDVAGNNYDLARRAAQGDYQNRIAGINATVQDAALTAPSTIGQMGGDTFNWKNAFIGMQVTFKTIAGAPRRAVIDYFRRYGYAIHRWMDLGSIRHLLCMKHFAYWKVLETTVVAADANESERNAIRGVFEKGVTLWDSPESIGTTDLADNAPRDGYSY